MFTGRFKLIPTLIYVCVFSLLVGLGLWQLDRSKQKQALLDLQKQSATAEPLHLSVTMAEELPRYRQVEVSGRYDVSHQFLIDNQISDGKAGYYVLTPLVLTGESIAVLVNRGWIPLSQGRSVIPDLPIQNPQAAVTGRINSFPSVGIKLAGAEIPTEGWPSVVQVVDSHVLAKKLGYTVFQFQIELDKGLPDGFKREWRAPTIMPPEQHTAYAMQWFALALTLTILFIWYSHKNNDVQSKK